MKFTILQIFIVLVLSKAANAQIPLQEHSFDGLYSKIIPHFPDTYLGSQYTEPNKSIGGHTSYLLPTFELGEIVINGFGFKEIPLIYDILDDLLITFPSIHRQKTILNQDKINRFTLADGSIFVKKENAPNYYFHRNGFYRQIIKDEIGLYCKHYIEINKSSSPLDPFKTYQEIKKFYLEFTDSLVLVSKAKKAFQLLDLTKKEIKPLARKSKVKFRKNKEEYLSIMVNYANRGRKEL